MKKRKSKKNNILVGLLLGLLGIVLVLYLGVAVFYMSHYCFNTEVNGELVEGKTVKDLQDGVKKNSSKYLITIKGRNDVVDYISSADVSLTPQFEGEFEEILHSQNSFLWPYYLLVPTSYETNTVVGYSKEDLHSVVKNLAFFKEENIVEPEDAYIPEKAGEKGFEIISETAGAKAIQEKVYSEIEAAVDILADEITLSDECYETAKITKDDSRLNTLITNLNQYCAANITYEFGNDIVKVDGNQIMEWITVNGTEVTLDEDAVREFVNGLARKYDTFGITREFKTNSGEVIEVAGGDYGWWMNRPEETAGLIEAIKNNESGVREPVYFATAQQYGANDYGDTYVEINLTDQHLWVYQEGKVVEESDFVSGNVKKGNGTPRGTYAITYKERDATLNGENYSSAVSYWMPFNGNVGMHDASWRSSFGGDLYLTSGSHGCINLPKKKAEAIFGIVVKHEPVIVYGGEEYVEPEEEPLTPEQQFQLLVEAGLLNPDGTIPEGSDVVEEHE